MKKTLGTSLGSVVRRILLAHGPEAVSRLNAASGAYRALSGISATLSACIANPSAPGVSRAFSTPITDNRHSSGGSNVAKHQAVDMCLVFTISGSAELEDEEGDVVWSSDEDGTWRERHPDELLGEGDTEEVLLYLADQGFLDEDELGDVEIEVDSAEAEEVSNLHGE